MRVGRDVSINLFCEGVEETCICCIYCYTHPKAVASTFAWMYRSLDCLCNQETNGNRVSKIDYICSPKTIAHIITYHTYIHTYIRAPMHTYIHTKVRTYHYITLHYIALHTHIHKYVHTYIHTYLPTYQYHTTPYHTTTLHYNNMT